MTLYSSIVVLISLLMIAMTIHVLTYSGFNKAQKMWFVTTFLSIAFCSVAEFAVHCGYYNANFAIPLTILTILQFSLSPVLAMLFSGALGMKHQGKIAGGFLAANLVVQVICAPFGAIFQFTAEGYMRGSYFLIYEIFYFVGTAYLLVALIFVGRYFRHRDIATVIMILIVLAAGILPMTLYKLHVAYAAIGISAALCYIFYNDLVQQDTQAELVSNQEKINSMQGHIISGLASLIESRDSEKRGNMSPAPALW